MRKKALCFFTFVLYVLAACTVLSHWIEETMMTRAELGPVNTKAAHTFVLRELPERALFRDERGLHLYEVYDGTGWESGKRTREVTGWTTQGDGTVYVPGYPDTAYVFSATRQPRAGEKVSLLESQERGDDTYLLIFGGELPKDAQLPLEAVGFEVKGNAALMEMRSFPVPFMEQRAKTASELTGFAERIFSLGDTEQFLNQLPRIAGGAAVLLAGLVFLIAAWRMPKAGLLRCVNGALAALCLCLLPGTLSKILLPGSLLPEENIFALSHYRTALDTVFNGLAAFPDAFQALAQVRDTAFSASGRVLLLGAGITAGILLLEYGLQWAQKCRKCPSK